MEMSKAEIVDFIEELAVELFYLSGESGPQARGAMLGLAITLDRLAEKLAKRKPSIFNVGEFA